MRRRRLLVVGGLTLVGLLVLGVALVAPVVARRLATQRLAEWFTVPVRIDDVDLNLFTGRARVRGIVVGEGGAPPLLRVPVLDLDVSYRWLVRGETVLRSTTVHDPELYVERANDGTLNVLQALRPAHGGGGGLTIEWLEIRGGTARFVDRTEAPPFERTLQNVQLTVRDLSTVRGDVEPAAFAAEVRIGDGTVAVTGSAQPFARPAAMELVATVRRLDLSQVDAYVPTAAAVDLAGSFLDADLRYVRDARDGPSRAHFLEAAATLGPARVSAAGSSAPALALDRIAARGIRLDFLAGRGTVGELTLRAPRLALLRAADGSWAGGSAGPAAGAAPSAGTRAETSRAGSGFPIVLERVRVDGGRLEVTDQTVDPAAVITVGAIQGTVTGLTLGGEGADAGVRATARLGEGAIEVSGSVAPETPAATVSVALSAVPLEILEPYANAALGTRTVRRGRVDGRFDVRLDRGEDDATRLELAGALAGRELVFGMSDAEDPLLTAEGLTADIEQLTLLPTLSARVGTIRLAAPVFRLRRDAQEGFNLARLWRGARGSRSAQAGPPEAAATPASAPPLRIARIEIDRGEILFRDTAVSPTFRERLAGLTASLRELRGADTRSPVALSSRVGRSASLELRGWVSPFGGPLRAHVEGALRDHELPHLNPYLRGFLGYEIRRGRGTLEVSYDYAGGRLEGSNTLSLEHLQLGPRVSDAFRETTGVPLPLALSILEGRGGVIGLTVPVSGEISKPQVTVGGIVADAVRSTVVRLVTSPFRLIGGAVTRAGRLVDLRIEPVEFLPGTTTPAGDPAARMEALAEVLRQRPRLELQILTRPAPDDPAALRAREVERQMAATGLGERAALMRLYAQAGGDPSFGAPSDDAMRRYVEERVEVTEADVRRLARGRARLIEGMLAALGVEPGRLFVVQEDTTPGPPRVELRLLY